VGDPEDSVTVDEEIPTWPPDKLTALRLGRQLVAEVPAAPGRRAFADITPILDQRDHVAEQEGWIRPDRQRSFRLTHWDYDERQLDGWDYDLDAGQIRADTCGEPRLLDVITAWGLTPAQFDYPWNTDDPR
jgi:hypothetical protein